MCKSSINRSKERKKIKKGEEKNKRGNGEEEEKGEREKWCR